MECTAGTCRRQSLADRRRPPATNLSGRASRWPASASAHSDPPAGVEGRTARPPAWRGGRKRLPAWSLSSQSSLSSSLLHTVRNRHDDVHLADFGHLRLQVANDRAVPALDDGAGVQSLDLEQGVVPVL